MHSSTGPTSNTNSTSTTVPRSTPAVSGVAPLTSQQSNAARTSVKPPATVNRPNNNFQSGPQQQQQQQQQQQRGNNNYYPQNNRGNYWNDNSQQDHSPARPSGLSVATAPNDQQVFVGSLPLEFTKETLIEYFTKHGNVLDAKIYTPTHESKKVCFVLND
jgi:RNA recognition motif-containing protein